MRVLLHHVGLFFAARIEEACRRAGAEAVASGAGASLDEEIARIEPDLVMIELERAELGEVRALRAGEERGGVRVVGFGAHVDEGLFAAAREAGFDEVLAKGALAVRLEALLRGRRP